MLPRVRAAGRRGGVGVSTRVVNECDVPGCTRRSGRVVRVNLWGLTRDNCSVTAMDDKHVCEACAATREGRAFVAALFEAFAAKLREVAS